MADFQINQRAEITDVPDGYLVMLDPGNADYKKVQKSNLLKQAPFSTLTGSTWDGSRKSVTLTANKTITLNTTLDVGVLDVKQSSTGGFTLSIVTNGITIPIPISATPDSRGFVTFYKGADGVYCLDYAAILTNTQGGSSSQLSTPTNFTSTSNSTSLIQLFWTPVNNASNYLIERSLTNNFSTIDLTMTVNGGSSSGFNDDSVVADTTYYYRIKAQANGYLDSNYTTTNIKTQQGIGAIPFFNDWSLIVNAADASKFILNGSNIVTEITTSDSSPKTITGGGMSYNSTLKRLIPSTISAYGVISNPINLPTDYCIAYRMKLSINKNNRLLESNSGGLYTVYFDNGGDDYYIVINGSASQGLGITPIESNELTLIVTKNGGELKTFVNGLLVNTNSQPVGGWSNIDLMWAGENSGEVPEYIKWISTGAFRTDAEVLQLHNYINSL